MSHYFAHGFRYLLDAHQRFWRVGLPVYLRVKNFDTTNAEYVEMGFQISPTTDTEEYTDFLIDPQPTVQDVSLHNIGMNATKLMFGARTFDIADTWVKKRMLDLGITDSYQVFRDRSVIGLYHDSRLFSIESVTTKEIAGETISWQIIGNAMEVTVE